MTFRPHPVATGKSAEHLNLMAKKPKDSPEVGDRVERRGFGQRGTLVQVDTDVISWCQVKLGSMADQC